MEVEIIEGGDFGEVGLEFLRMLGIWVCILRSR